MSEESERREEDDLGHPSSSQMVTESGRIVTAGEVYPQPGSNPVGTEPPSDAPPALSGRAMLLITQFGNEYALMENTETHQVFVCRTAVESDGLGLLFVSEHDEREEALGALLLLRAQDMTAEEHGGKGGQGSEPD